MLIGSPSTCAVTPPARWAPPAERGGGAGVLLGPCSAEVLGELGAGRARAADRRDDGAARAPGLMTSCASGRGWRWTTRSRLAGSRGARPSSKTSSRRPRAPPVRFRGLLARSSRVRGLLAGVSRRLGRRRGSWQRAGQRWVSAGSRHSRHDVFISQLISVQM